MPNALCCDIWFGVLLNQRDYQVRQGKQFSENLSQFTCRTVVRTRIGRVANWLPRSLRRSTSEDSEIVAEPDSWTVQGAPELNHFPTLEDEPAKRCPSASQPLELECLAAQL